MWRIVEFVWRMVFVGIKEQALVEISQVYQ